MAYKKYKAPKWRYTAAERRAYAKKSERMKRLMRQESAAKQHQNMMFWRNVRTRGKKRVSY